MLSVSELAAAPHGSLGSVVVSRRLPLAQGAPDITPSALQEAGLQLSQLLISMFDFRLLLGSFRCPGWASSLSHITRFYKPRDGLQKEGQHLPWPLLPLQQHLISCCLLLLGLHFEYNIAFAGFRLCLADHHFSLILS
jgi:hypothetical protein